MKENSNLNFFLSIKIFAFILYLQKKSIGNQCDMKSKSNSVLLSLTNNSFNQADLFAFIRNSVNNKRETEIEN